MTNMLQIVQTVQTGSAAILKIGGLKLLLPQSDIRTLESATDIDASATVLHSVGWVTYAQKRWPVYCLSDELRLMAAAPPERRACAMLAMGAGYLGLMCDDMIMQKNYATKHYELPVAMRLPDTPILHFVDYEQGIACASNAMRLTAYIEQLVSTT
jgi:hypothetical protein